MGNEYILVEREALETIQRQLADIERTLKSMPTSSSDEWLDNDKFCKLLGISKRQPRIIEIEA